MCVHKMCLNNNNKNNNFLNYKNLRGGDTADMRKKK